MPGKPYPSDVIKQARDVVQAWKNIDPAFKVGEMDVSALEGEVADAVSIQDRISSLKTQLTDQRNAGEAANTSVWDKVKRTRNAIKGVYGDNSSQYEMAGGTRLSERKTPARKKAANDQSKTPSQ